MKYLLLLAIISLTFGSAIAQTDATNAKINAPASQAQAPSVNTKTSAKVADATAAGLIHLDKATSVINPIYVKDSTRIEAIKIHLTRDKAPDANTTDTVIFTVAQNLFPFTIDLVNDKISIASTSWENDTFNTVLYIKNKYISDTLNGNEDIAYINISGDKKYYHAIRLTEKGAYDAGKPFWLEVGSNFDMTNGLQPNNLYAGIFMHKKDVAKWFGHPAYPNISLFGGIYESKSNSSSLSSDSGLVYRDGRSYIPYYNNDTPVAHRVYPIFRDTGTVSISTTVYSLGLFFSPQLRLTKGSAESNGLHVFASLWLEMLWQKTQQQFDYSKLDSLKGPNYAVNSIAAVNSVQAKQSATTISDFRSHYYGIGLPLYLKENNSYFYLNPVFGITTQRFNLSSDQANSDGASNNIMGLNTNIIRPWNFFYLFQFRLNDDQYGIAITGEIRGMIYPNTKPSISLALSKKFNLNALAKLIVSPF